MAVPRPRPIDQNEAMACIAKPFLQETPCRAGDAVIRDGRIAIVRDASDSACLFGISVHKGCVKFIKHAAWIIDQLRCAGIVVVDRGLLR